MSLPTQLSAKVKSIPMDPLALANNIELAYMLSYSSYNLSSDSAHCSAKDTYNSPLFDYSFVDFDEPTYQALFAETCKNYQSKNSTVVRSIRNSFKQFYTRASAMTYSTVLKKDELFQATSTTSLKVPSFEAEYKLDQMRGNKPSDWPRNLKQFHQEITKLPWNAFACQPTIYFQDFLQSSFQVIRNFIKNIKPSGQNKSQFFKDISLIVQIILMVSLKTNNQTFILTQLQTLNALDLQAVFSEKQVSQLVSMLMAICEDIFQKIPVNEQQQYHMPKKLWERGPAFMIMKKIIFQRQNGLGFFSIANDGTYIYVYVSSINGGMYKIGTGKNFSIPGKIYLQKEVLLAVGSKLDEVNWVYLKGKLYLKTTARQPFCLEVINPQTFKTEQIIELKCNPLFGHQSLINLNRNSIILTDSTSLYFLGRQLKITKGKEDKKQQQVKTPKEEQDPKGKKKKSKKQKNQQAPVQSQQTNPQQTDKIVQFILYQFDLEEEKNKKYDCEESLAQDLYLSFNSYFTIEECRKALDLCDNDLSEAAQWLVDEGEKERTTKIFYPVRKCLIAQSQISSNFAEKNLKGSNQIITKEGSILHTQNVNESIWTMDEDEITCYSEAGLKIFSKQPTDTHQIAGSCGLKTTHLKTVQGKFQRNPEYTISYDPYNKSFYTFTWSTDGGHYFPTAVLIGSDSKHSGAQLAMEKRMSVSQMQPKSINEFSKWLLVQMNLIDNSHCPEQGRVNNWLWYFAQKIIDLNKQINANNQVDKKKFINKRSKLLTKMNRVNEYYKIYERQKQQFEKTGKVRSEILLIPPFGCDGTIENLQKIRNIFGKKLDPSQVYPFIFALQGWLDNDLKLPNHKIHEQLYKIQEELLELKKNLNPTTSRKLTNLFISHFYEFFETIPEQQRFIASLEKDEIASFVEKHHQNKHKFRRSIVYEIKEKQNILPKFESKTKFEQIFPTSSNVTIQQISGLKETGNLLSSAADPEAEKSKAALIKALEKFLLSHANGIKLLQYIFLEAFRSIVRNKAFSEYGKSLKTLFLDTFKLIETVIAQANVGLIKNLCDPINQILQLYFASLCSFQSCSQIIEILLKILDGLQKKQIIHLLNFVEDMEFQGISQTSQKVYETPHPIERGKNQSFPPLRIPQASLLYAEFDKRCQSDPNHDILSIQITHENQPVGNSINCNDGVFYTNLRLTGKVDSGKPYLIMGNSVNIDFSSSGHAKDSKSFGRFGFKFGLRPIYAGKIKYKKNTVEKIEKTFGSKSEFEKYINTLKLLSITISNSIQNLTFLERVQEQNKETQKFLNGKIFKEGYQQEVNLVKISTESFDSFNFEREFSQHHKTNDGRTSLLKILHADSFKQGNKKLQETKVAKVDQNQNEIWDLEGIPSYIKSYVQKIKNFSGDFIDVFLQARNLALPKGIYATELKKSGFNQEMKKLWLQGEAILFLTVLKHSGLLHLNLKFSIEYIKANLKAFEQARNGIYEAFIGRMQIVREWRDLLETYENRKQQKQQDQKEEKKDEGEKQQKPAGKGTGIQIKKKGMVIKTIKFDNKDKVGVKKVDSRAEKKLEKKQQDNAKEAERKKQIEKLIRQRLTEDYMIKSICTIKKIEYVPKQTFENVTRIINRLEEESKSNRNQIESVYVEPIQHLIRSCLFLLKLKSSSSKEMINQEDLEPEEIFRSYSQDPRHENLNKVKIFREWLENWKKWKDFKKEGKVQLKFPVSEIIQFVNSWIPLTKFRRQIELRFKLASNRTKFYEFNNNLLKSTSNSFLSKYVLGVEVANIKAGHNAGLESVSSSKLAELTNKYNQYSVSLKLEEEKKFKQLPLKLQEIQSLIKSESDGLLQRIKLISVHLFLIEAENPDIELDIAMYFIPFKYLNMNQQQLTFISSLIVQKAFLTKHKLSNILQTLWKEIGRDSISCKRWRDYFFIERVLFLLRKLENQCRHKLQIGEKQRVAEVLFHMIYHLQIPLICRISLRILNLLKITFKRDIETPFCKTYKAISFEQKQLKVNEFKIENPPQYSNPEMVATKCYNIFRGLEQNEIKEKLLAPFKDLRSEESQKKQDTYNILLNMNQEEDIVWMVAVLYYIEEIENTIVPIKDWEEYLSKKNKKKEHHKDKDKQANNNTVEAQVAVVGDKKIKKMPEQRILQNIPNDTINLPDAIQVLLPAGWFFNYCNIYNEFTTKAVATSLALPLINIQNPPNLNPKKNKNANQVVNPAGTKKQWNAVEFLKLYKKFEDLTSKPLEEPKEEQSEEIKTQFIKAKNFILRMRKHCAQVSIIFSNLSQTGYYLFREDVPKEKCEMICQLFSLGGQNRLKQIPCDFKTKDYGTRLTAAYISPAKKSDLRITCIRSDQYRKFNELISAPSNVSIRVQNNPLLYYTNLGVGEFILEDKCHLPYQQFPQVDGNEDDVKIDFSKYFMESSISRMKKRQDEVYLKEYQNLRYFITQGGLESGLSSCTLVPTFDASLTCQKSSFDNVYPSKPKRQLIDDPQQLLEKATKIMKGSFQQIKDKQQIISYMLITCYLQKLTKVDMAYLDSKLVKDFAETLYKFAKGFKAGNSTDVYKQKIQILITKMLDADNQNLSRFRLYRFEEDKLCKQLTQFVDDKLKSSLKQQKLQSSQETTQSHQYPKSNYLLPVHPPISEENNLLGYWQKNILPKIYEFVKSSLKQIEIDDFFQQMRIPLRKNDQLEAKKIAYVICDNKLPQGAVLPDANHNWNSLTIDDVTVGQDVLIKLSKHKNESSSPLMYGRAQQYRVGQVMLIDQKNLSALVRHRLPQYALFVYSWVPINSLEAVEESLVHYSSQTIYKNLEESFKGLIYNYAQICMTKLSTKIKISMEELIEETIVDMFRDNPISGWNEDKQWALRPALKNLLQEGNAKIAEMIEDKFCPIKSYDIDLYSENMLSLNKFDNVLGLVVEFKKVASLIWYSGINFYADPYGFKQIAKTYASRSCRNQLEPLEFKNPNVYAKYYTNKQSLKPFEQNKYDQKEIIATIFGVDPAWTVSTYLANVVGEIAIEENKYEDILTRINKVFLKWLEKRQFIYLSTQLCRVITTNTLRIKKLYSQKEKPLSLQSLGSSEAQLKSFIQWINALVEGQEKDMIVLYSPLLQNLLELVASMLSGMQKQNQSALTLPTHVQQMMKMIQMTSQIQRCLTGKKTKKVSINNDTQWERILVVENIPSFLPEKDLRESLKTILVKNNGKVLSPTYDIFCSNGKAVILVDSWDITELVEEEIIQKMESQEEKQPEPEGDQGLLMQWACQVCTYINPAGNTHCQTCDSPAPAPKVQIVYEKVESKDVNETEQKLKQKQKKRFEKVKQQVLAYIDEAWKNECARVDKLRQAEQKNKQQRRKKKGKAGQVEQKVIEKPQKPNITLLSGSDVLSKTVAEQFLKKRFQNLPDAITRKVNSQQKGLYLSKFKELSKLGFDLWGDNIANESPTLLSLQMLSDLMSYIQDEICKGSSSVLSYSQSSIRLLNQIPLLIDKQGNQEPLNFIAENNVGVKIKYSKLAQQKSYNIRYSWKIIKELNLSASKCLPMINMNLPSNNNTRKICSTNLLGANIKCLRQLIMGALKLELFKKIMQKTSVALEPQDIPKISLERLKIKEQPITRKPLISLKDKDDFLFTKAHEQLQKISSINLRPFKPKGTEPFLSFGVNFKGQMVQGEAGPYRQFFTDMSTELHPETGLNLFIKTPNNVHKTGEGRSKWTINPKANSTYYLSLFHFLGRLMGCCIRTGCHMPIDLANFCWKLIADEKVKKNDVYELDRKFFEQNQQLINCPSEETFDCMEQVVEEPVTWVYTTVDGEEQELIPNGRNERVSYDQRIEYVKMMEKRRIQQISLQVNKIREGLYEMIPESFLNNISGEQLKTMVCGVPKVDVQLLKKHTKYAGGLNEETPVIKYFWEMMKEITEEERLKIIRFCWGQQRLPLNSQQFQRNGIRFMIKPMLNNQNPDQALPKADTCFFNIELPKYSTKNIMKERVLLAVNLDSTSINADRNMMPDDNPLMGNVDYEDENEDEENGGGGG